MRKCSGHRTLKTQQWQKNSADDNMYLNVYHSIKNCGKYIFKITIHYCKASVSRMQKKNVQNQTKCRTRDILTWQDLLLVLKLISMPETNT